MSVTEYLAIYAACLSTIVFIWNIARAVPRFKVRLVSGFDEIDGEYVFGVCISVQNPSPHTVHLSGIDLLYPSEDMRLSNFLRHLFKYRRFSRSVGWVYTSLSNYKIEDGCPITLEPGQSHNILVPDHVVEEVLENSQRRELKAVAHDQLWGRKHSNKFSVAKVASVDG